jgi:hypothetical protein
MRAQGLFHQRGSGARKTEHEQRLCEVGTRFGARQRAEPAGDEEALQSRDQPLGLRVEILLARQLTKRRPARIEGGEGLGKFGPLSDIKKKFVK